jgi:hypothetical protein
MLLRSLIGGAAYLAGASHVARPGSGGSGTMRPASAGDSRERIATADEGLAPRETGRRGGGHRCATSGRPSFPRHDRCGGITGF